MPRSRSARYGDNGRNVSDTRSLSRTFSWSGGGSGLGLPGNPADLPVGGRLRPGGRGGALGEFRGASGPAALLGLGAAAQQAGDVPETEPAQGDSGHADPDPPPVVLGKPVALEEE